MKKHIVIPVTLRTFRDEETGWFGKELVNETLNYPKNQDFFRSTEGTAALEALLDAGWSIVSVQSAMQPGGDHPGAAFFVYILESPESN